EGGEGELHHGVGLEALVREEPVKPDRDPQGGQQVHAQQEPEIDPPEPPPPDEGQGGDQAGERDDDRGQGGQGGQQGGTARVLLGAKCRGRRRPGGQGRSRLKGIGYHSRTRWLRPAAACAGGGGCADVASLSMTPPAAIEPNTSRTPAPAIARPFP